MLQTSEEQDAYTRAPGPRNDRTPIGRGVIASSAGDLYDENVPGGLRAPGHVSSAAPFRPSEIWTGMWSHATWTRSALLRLAGALALLTMCSWLGIVLSRQSEGVATIWLSNGILFGLVITRPPRQWLGYFAAGLCADTLADMLYGDRFG